MALSQTDLAERLHVATTAAQAAGAALLSHYGQRDRLAVESKGVNDFVSNADREAEAIIEQMLMPAFPIDGFLGEETGASGSADAGAVWCVDPLDGTTNFLKGAHNWCVSIGLWSEGQAVLGVIHDPLRNETFSAARGQGVHCNGIAIRVSDVDRLDSASLGLGHNRRVPVNAFAEDVERLLSTGAGFRQIGAGALMLAYVAAGRVDAYLERHMWPWDAVAGLALISEAGGVIHPYLPMGGALAAGGAVVAMAPGLRAELDGLMLRG
jgi:myo-inositol-1(or 4)-monophosphatase